MGSHARTAISAAVILAFAVLLAGALVARTTLLENESPAAEGASAGAAKSPGGEAHLGDEPVPAGMKTDAMEDCLAALAVPEGSSRLMTEQRALHVASFLKEQGSQLEQDLVADIAAYRPAIGAVLDNGLPASLFWTYNAPDPLGERELSATERRRLEHLIDEGVEELAALDDAELLRALWDDTTVTGYLIREHGEALYRALPTLGVQLPITAHELAIAIEEGIALAGFRTLLEAADVDLAATWRNGANLAKVAAIHLQPDILRFLMSNGVDPTAPASWGHRSVLDDIASLGKPHDTEPLADVVEQLKTAGDQPYLPSTLSTLRQWLPETPSPELHPDATAALTPAVAEAARTLVAMNADWTRKIDAAARLEQRCDALLWSEQHAGAFEGSGLTAKRRHEEALLRREQRWLDHLGRTAEEKAETTDDEQALADAVSEGRWTDAVAIADKIGGYKPFVLLVAALNTDAPLDILLALTQRSGGLLPEDALRYLADNARPDASAIAEALEPFGLDPHYVDERGRNAFSILAERSFETEGTWRFAEYLASRSVATKPTAFGLDPLDIALTKLLEHPRWHGGNIRFARFLIDNGAPVELSHRQLARLIATADADVHRRLLTAVPELAW